MSGKGETFTNSDGGKSASIVRESGSGSGSTIETTVVNDKGVQKATYDRKEAEKLHEQLGKVLYPPKNK